MKRGSGRDNQVCAKVASCGSVIKATYLTLRAQGQAQYGVRKSSRSGRKENMTRCSCLHRRIASDWTTAAVKAGRRDGAIGFRWRFKPLGSRGSASPVIRTEVGSSNSLQYLHFATCNLKHLFGSSGTTQPHPSPLIRSFARGRRSPSRVEQKLPRVPPYRWATRLDCRS
jgi:hypothetical protein